MRITSHSKSITAVVVLGFYTTAFTVVACSASQTKMRSLKTMGAGCFCSYRFHYWRTNLKSATGHQRQKIAWCPLVPYRECYHHKTTGELERSLMRPSTGIAVPLRARLEHIDIILQGRPQAKVLRTQPVFNMRPRYLSHKIYHHLTVLNPDFVSSSNNFRGSIPRQLFKGKKRCNVARNSVSGRSD